jgi:hypothetical protein
MSKIIVAGSDPPVGCPKCGHGEMLSMVGDLQGIGHVAVGQLENLAVLADLDVDEVESAC